MRLVATQEGATGRAVPGGGGLGLRSGSGRLRSSGTADTGVEAGRREAKAGEAVAAAGTARRDEARGPEAAAVDQGRMVEEEEGKDKVAGAVRREEESAVGEFHRPASGSEEVATTSARAGAVEEGAGIAMRGGLIGVGRGHHIVRIGGVV